MPGCVCSNVVFFSGRGRRCRRRRGASASSIASWLLGNDHHDPGIRLFLTLPDIAGEGSDNTSWHSCKRIIISDTLTRFHCESEAFSLTNAGGRHLEAAQADRQRKSIRMFPSTRSFANILFTIRLQSLDLLQLIRSFCGQTAA